MILDEIIYRKINPNEAKLYRKIRLECLKNYPNRFGSSYEQQKQKPKLGFENYIEKSHPEKFVVGAFYQNKIIGICGFHRHNDKRCKHRGEIIQMYVKESNQGNGIGFNLLQKTIDEGFKINGLTQIELGVVTNVKAACRIYEKAGFKEAGLLKNFFYVNDDSNGSYLDERLMVLFKENR